jgi:outer membrane protein assembly factor BamA
MVAALVLAVGIDAHSLEKVEGKSFDQPIQFTIPTAYKVKKIALFPFELPMLVIKGVTMPIGGIFQVLEETHTIERVADFLSNEDHTLWVYPIVEGGAGSGFGGGPGLHDTDLFGTGYKFNTYYTIHINLNQHAFISIGKDDAFKLFNKPVSFFADIDWNNELDADYYGIGSGSSKNNHSKFSYRNIEGSSDFSYNLIDHLSLLAHVGFIFANTGASTEGGYPSVDTTFAPSQIRGFSQRIIYMTFGIGLEHDTRNRRKLPSRGGLREFNFYRYQTISGGDYSYNEYMFDFTQHFPLWRPGVILTLHNGWKFEQALGDNAVPFFRLSTLDASNLLHSYNRGRFKDRASAIFNLEYRYPVWSMLDAIIIADTGRVFRDITDFSFTDFRYSVGGGFDIDFMDAIIFKFRGAYGAEGAAFTFGITKSG